MGISDSSRVATAIFLHHIVVLSILFVSSVVYGINHPHVFRDNMHSEYPAVDFAGSMLDGNVLTAIFFGFGASMLGITGFESSSNYVEEQAPGVFRKTLRNMWGVQRRFRCQYPRCAASWRIEWNLQERGCSAGEDWS